MAWFWLFYLTLAAGWALGSWEWSRCPNTYKAYVENRFWERPWILLTGIAVGIIAFIATVSIRTYKAFHPVKEIF